MKRNPLLELQRWGQSPWLDYIARDLIDSGEIERLIKEEGISGITSNPTIFEKAVTSGSYYDEAIKLLSQEGKTAEEIYEVITTQDVRAAADLLKGVYQHSDGEDGYVSIEVPPKYAYDVEETVRSATTLFNLIGRDNILIKVPATEEGMRAIPRLISRGININITLIFSLPQYKKAANAYIQGLKEKEGRGEDLKGVSSVASIFVSRIDTAIDPMLDDLASQEKDKAEEILSLRGRIAIANCKLIYQAFTQIFSSPDFLKLTGKGARIQKIVWGSTSTKDPQYSDIKYVAGLIGRGTINTMPLPTIWAFKDHGIVGATLEEGLEEAERELNKIKEWGIDLEAVCQRIQEEGVKAFATSFDSLLAAIEYKIKQQNL